MTAALPLPFGFAAPAAAVVRTGHASESWTITATDVDAWLRSARPGESLVYAHGPQLVQGGAAARVTELTRTGEVTPHHKRADDGGFDFIIRRNRVQAAPRPPVCDPVMLSVLCVLQDAAAKGERCPSDAAIGEATDLTADQVKWQLKKLKASGFIACETVRTKADPRFRQVTVIATGAKTAGPAS